MTEPGRFSTEAQRYLDGESPIQVDPAERASADRLASALAIYTAHLSAPDERVDSTVMRAIAAERRGLSTGAWQWMFTPQVVRVRPALLALAAALVLMFWWTNTRPQPVPTGSAVAAAAPDTVLVRFELSAPSAHEVSLAGSFNGWNSSGIALRRSQVPGLWTVTVPLPVGEYQYLFIVDGTQWLPDPTAHAQVDDGFGRSNSVIVVGPRGLARS